MPKGKKKGLKKKGSKKVKERGDKDRAKVPSRLTRPARSASGSEKTKNSSLSGAAASAADRISVPSPAALLNGKTGVGSTNLAGVESQAPFKPFTPAPDHRSAPLAVPSFTEDKNGHNTAKAIVSGGSTLNFRNRSGAGEGKVPETASLPATDLSESSAQAAAGPASHNSGDVPHSKEGGRSRIGGVATGTSVALASPASRPGSGRLASLVPSRPSSRPSSGYASSLPPSRPTSGVPTRGLDTIEHHLVRAAELLINADYVLIAAGAGFSADSGLPVYKDIANVEAYKRLKLTYADLCTPDWLQRDPEMFFGFWGSCFNDYMDTEPHQGYGICKRWSDTHFYTASGEIAQQAAVQSGGNDTRTGGGSGSGRGVSSRLSRLSLIDAQTLAADGTAAPLPSSSRPPSSLPPRPSLHSAGRLQPATRQAEEAGRGARRGQGGGKGGQSGKACKMFVYTSNVDTAFRRAGFAREQIFEIHGNVCDWQCAKPGRCKGDTWIVPSQRRFTVDKQRMRAPRWAMVPVASDASSECARGNGEMVAADDAHAHGDAEQAASARTTHRGDGACEVEGGAAWHSGNTAVGCDGVALSVSGGGMRAVRGLSAAAVCSGVKLTVPHSPSSEPAPGWACMQAAGRGGCGKEETTPRPWPRREGSAREHPRPMSAASTSSCTSSSSSSSSSAVDRCSSPGGWVSAGAGGAAGAAPAAVATPPPPLPPVLSLSAYSMGRGSRHVLAPLLQLAPTLHQADARMRELEREREREAGAGAARKMEKVLNHVQCEGCGRAARPNILMFDDDDWVTVQAGHYKRFAKEALAAVNKSGARLVVLEGGCGKRVPTVRLNSEKLVKHGAELVRINLDYPSNSKGASKTVSLAINVLAALQGIDMAIRRLRGVE